MSTAISVLGGIGLFLLGMTIMTDGLKGLAGSSLRTVLGKAAATPLSGMFWGAIITLLVQSSSATTMTTIGLVSAGLLTFPQALGLVFGANVGTTGTGWLVALIGVRVSLSSYALPLIFVGALAKLMGSGRIAAAGASLAGFALVLYGLTTLQQGMGGVAAQLHPSDLPAVIGAPGAGWLSGWLGLLSLVVIGLVMTAVMQSSTAAIAVTLSAFYAGAVGLDQGCALIIGQNIGTATSSAMAAIGASTTAKRLALAYILFKIIAALIALALFPITIPLILRASGAVDGVTLLAAYHTAYNVVGVAVLMPFIDRFTRFVERLLPDASSPLTRGLDPAVLENPVVAVEAVRRTIALAIEAICQKVDAAVSGDGKTGAGLSIAEPVRALRQARDFMSEVSGPPDSDREELRLTSTLHALDHVSRLAEIAGEEPEFPTTKDGPDEERAARLCAKAMRSAQSAVGDIAGEKALSDAAAPIDSMETLAAGSALARLEESARILADLRRAHRGPTLSKVATGVITADQAMARIETVRRLEALARHAWRGAAHLLGHIETPAP
ncbi:Na/Pi cotransporter family protein [Rhodoblastus sp.]|uniref:Na/Pi cotransporter family protein n=1 Tax=Rhodoblastus sp. TaxID=1962975 RepID=UPI003F9D814E